MLGLTQVFRPVYPFYIVHHDVQAIFLIILIFRIILMNTISKQPDVSFSVGSEQQHEPMKNCIRQT